jgi:hypothetical protein
MLHMPSFSDAYRIQWEKIQKQILSEADAYLLGTTTGELVEYYLSKSCFEPIVIDPERDVQMEFKKALRKVTANQRDRGYRDHGETEYEFETLIVHIPIVKNPNIYDFAKLQTSTYSIGWSPGDWGLNSDEITRSLDIKGYGFNFSDDEARIAQMIDQAKTEVLQWIGWVNNDIQRENASLERQITEFIENRKVKIESDKSKMESLTKRINIPLKKTESTAAQRVRLDPKPLVRKIRPTAQAVEDYVLDEAKVLDIISVIDGQGRQFEKTPATYKDFGEEDLRNVILVGLNSVLEGRATGETFSAKGKSDIYLNIDKGNILICECKIWGGKKLYHETINQLFGYLTWRHNFGIIITFVKQKNLTKILDQIPETVSKHPSFKTGVKRINETHFVSNHKLNQDDDKEVEIHHLFYNLYVS